MRSVIIARIKTNKHIFRVSDHVSQLFSSSPKNFGKKGLIVATLIHDEDRRTPRVLLLSSLHPESVSYSSVRNNEINNDQ